MGARAPYGGWLALLVLIAGCAPAGRDSPGRGADAASAAAVDSPKVLTLGQLRPLKAFAIDTNTTGGVGPLIGIHTLGLITQDERGNKAARLATDLPSLHDGTVALRSDGRMETSWRLRSDVTWHDGTPFTVEDVVFSFAASVEPEMRSAGMENLERAEALDPSTVRLTWRRPYYDALNLSHGKLWLLPKHLLADAFAGDKAEFFRLPYFTTDYVHLGPFRLADWGFGEQLVFERYDRYFLGQPKLTKIVIRAIGDPNAMYASLLAGAVDVASERTIPSDVLADLREQWSRTPDGRVLTRPQNWRYIWFQFNPEFARPSELARDVRLRMGFLFGLDRDALRELMEPGIPDTSGDSFMPANDPRNATVGKPFARYPYDPTRASAEWASAGWVRAPDGRVVDQNGQPVEAEVRSLPAEAKQVSAIAGGWRHLGIDTREYVTPPALTQDREFRSQFPAMEARGRGAAEEVFVSFDGRERAAPENRWSGVNKAQYANPALDRLIDALYATVDATERGHVMRDMGEILATDLPAIPLYWATQFMAVRAVVGGPIYEDYPQARDPGGETISRNAHLWDRTH